MTPGQTINSNILPYTISNASRHYKNPCYPIINMVVAIKRAAQSRQIKAGFNMFVSSTKNVG